jgi:hypothetical protein
LDELWSFVKTRQRLCQPWKNWRLATQINGCGSGLIHVTKSWSTSWWDAITSPLLTSESRGSRAGQMGTSGGSRLMN